MQQAPLKDEPDDTPMDAEDLELYGPADSESQVGF